MRNWKIRNEDLPTTNDDSDGDPRVIAIESKSNESPQGNRIYFYSDVNRDTILNLNKQIDELTKQLRMVQLNFNLPKPARIEIHICSDGGDVFSAIASVDKIMDNPIPVDTYCEGMVASASTLLSVVGARRYISKSSCMLIHQVSSGLWGNYDEFKDELKNLELIMSLIKGVYAKKTKIITKELNELLSHDLYLNAEQCLDYGLVDEII